MRNWLFGLARQRLREISRHSAADAGAEVKIAAEPSASSAQAGARSPRPVCHLGLVFALSIEAGGFIDRLAGVVRIQGDGFVAREGGFHGRRLVVVESGPGAAAAARATRALISGHEPQWVISAGFAGGLTDQLLKGDILLADQLIDQRGRQLQVDFKLDPDDRQRSPHLHVGRLLTVERIVRDPAEKRSLGATHGALAVDMETLAVADVCRDEKVRFIAVRVISDAVDRALPHDIERIVARKTTAGRLGAATRAVLRRPASLKDMWQLKEDALVASERLANFLAGIIPQLTARG